MSAGIQRDLAHGSADRGGKLMVGVVGVRLQGIELILQQLLLCGELDGVAPNPGVANVDSPIRRDGPAASIGGPLDVIKFRLARADVRLGT
jgi:hypothetical protein